MAGDPPQSIVVVGSGVGSVNRPVDDERNDDEENVIQAGLDSSGVRAAAVARLRRHHSTLPLNVLPET
jgi:aryl carrier-like protein